jgi:hypothetical protein
MADMLIDIDEVDREKAEEAKQKAIDQMAELRKS